VRLPQRVVVPLADLGAGVSDLASSANGTGGGEQLMALSRYAAFPQSFQPGTAIVLGPADLYLPERQGRTTPVPAG